MHFFRCLEDENEWCRGKGNLRLSCGREERSVPMDIIIIIGRPVLRNLAEHFLYDMYACQIHDSDDIALFVSRLCQLPDQDQMLQLQTAPQRYCLHKVSAGSFHSFVRL